MMTSSTLGGLGNVPNPSFPYNEFPLNTIHYVYYFMSRKKQHAVKTTSRRTGAMLLIAVIVIVSLSVVFLILAMSEAEKQKSYEENWRLQPCKDMISDSIANPELWKHNAVIDKGC